MNSIPVNIGVVVIILKPSDTGVGDGCIVGDGLTVGGSLGVGEGEVVAVLVREKE
jgi:hypothetical protein